MDGVSVASSIAGLVTLALQISGTITAYVSAVKDRSKDVREFQDEIELLSGVLGQLRDFLQTETAKGRSFDDHSVLRQAILDCRARIERIGDKLNPGGSSSSSSSSSVGPAMMSKVAKVAKVVERLKWPFEKVEVLQMVENLRRYTHIFQFALSLEGCTLLARTSRDVEQGLGQMLDMSKKITEMSLMMGISADEATKRTEQIQQILGLLQILSQNAETVREVSHAVRLAEIREQERRTKEILDWLAPISSLNKHLDMQAKRSAGTGTWFLEDETFLQWVQESDLQCDLLCLGGPGIGKSVLCSMVFDFLKQKYTRHEVATVCYYCDYAEQQLQSGMHLARCILRQLCASCNALPTVVTEFYQKTKNQIRDQMWFHELKAVLQKVMATFDKCFVVIDAFDETDAREQRIGLLEVLDVIRNAPGVTKIFATTRPHIPNIEDKFCSPVRINIAANEQDIRFFLSKKIDSHTDSDFILDAVLKNEILDKLCANAHGMFLLPALQIQHVLDQVTKADVRKALNGLSTDLPSVFTSTLDRIRAMPAARRNVASSTLMWLSHALRPLTIEELQNALAIRFDETSLNQDNFTSVRTILESCCGLVELDQENSHVRLVHFSLEEYLQSHDHSLFKDSHVIITRACIQYLSFKDFERLPFKSRLDFVDATHQFRFLEYACWQWGHHARKIALSSYEDLAVPLLRNSSSLLLLAKIYDTQAPDYAKWNERMLAWATSDGAGISVAAGFGLTDLTRLLISRCPVPTREIRNMYGSTPLHEAAANGYESVAELFIAHKADLLDDNKGKATPFFLAVSFGRLSMAQTLLQYSHKQLYLTNHELTSPLHKAVAIGSVPMVEFLVQAGAKVDARDNRGMTSLHHAAQRRHLEICKVLVKARATISMVANNKSSALDLAAASGDGQLVEFFLDHGAVVRDLSKQGMNALHRAARNGHANVVQILQKRGADILSIGWKRTIPLHQAARSGDLKTVKILLDVDDILIRKQITFANQDGVTAREIAFFTAHYDIYKHLRSEEWRLLGTEQSDRMTDLDAAIEAGDLDLVRALVTTPGDEETNLETPNEDGQCPLHVAVQEQQFAIAEYLLSTGRCSVRTPGYHGWKALDIAASLGDLRMVELCLAHGANVHAASTSGQTALHKATSCGSVAVMETLLDAGANPEARNDRGMTPLHVAANHSHMEAIKFLLRVHNVNIHTRDRDGKTATQWAERNGNLEVINFLRLEEKKSVRLGHARRRSTGLSRSSTNVSLTTPEPLSRTGTLSRPGSAQEVFNEHEEADLLLFE